MKQLFYIASIVLLLATTGFGCKNKGSKSDMIVVPATASGKPTDKYPVMTFEKTTHDFGKIIRGEKVTYRFKFTNTGKLPLIVSSVSSSCGCTVPEYSQLPVAPGQDGFIEVTFNSQGLDGFKTKSVNVFSNAQPPSQTLTINAHIGSINQ